LAPLPISALRFFYNFGRRDGAQNGKQCAELPCILLAVAVAAPAPTAVVPPPRPLLSDDVVGARRQGTTGIRWPPSLLPRNRVMVAQLVLSLIAGNELLK